MSNLHKETKKVFSEVMNDLYNYVDPKNGRHCPMISKQVLDIINTHADRLNSAIVYERDYTYQYFGFKTLERSYLLRLAGKVCANGTCVLNSLFVWASEEGGGQRL